MARLLLLAALVAAAPLASAQGAFTYLGDNDDTLDDGEFFTTATVEVRQGETLHVVMDSPDFDPYLMVTLVGKPDVLAHNDDCTLLDADRACLSYTPVSDGEIKLWFTTYGAGETGFFRALWGTGDAAPEWVFTVRNDGTLDADSPMYSTGEHYNGFSTLLLEGDRVALRVGSEDFDAFAVLVAPDGTEHANDDCSSATREACLDIVADQSGEWSIRITSYAAGETGAYRYAMGFNTPAGEELVLDGAEVGPAIGVTFGAPKE